MKILYITPENPNIVTPETGFAKDLEKLGHEVTFIFGTTQYDPKILNGKYVFASGAQGSNCYRL